MYFTSRDGLSLFNDGTRGQGGVGTHVSTFENSAVGTNGHIVVNTATSKDRAVTYNEYNL